MKRYSKSILGVTLLEIMLVLAVAAMVIVMSIRYYQSATTSQNANVLLQQIQAITAAADSLAQGTATYSSVAGSSVGAIVGGVNLRTPYGGTITIGPGSGQSYTVTIPSVPPGVCRILKAQLLINSKFSVTSECSTAAADFKYTYTATTIS